MLIHDVKMSVAQDAQQMSFIKKSRILIRKYFLVFFLATTAFAYYYIISDVLTNITTNFSIHQSDKTVIMGLFYIGIGVSTFAGAVLSNKYISRGKLIHFWLLLAIFSSFLSFCIKNASISMLTMISLFWGITVGLGMPSSLALFADSTVVETRGRRGGLLAFVFNACLFGLALLLGELTSSSKVQAFMIWLGFSFIFSILLRKEIMNITQETKNPKLLLILRERRFMLYLIPWIMFCLVNSLEAPILRNFFGNEFFEFVIVTESAISSIFAIVGGFFADNVGRKIMAIIGFVVLGVGYAVLSLFSNVQTFWYLYIVVDGIAWGIFVVLFFLVLWGDLAGNMLKEKYYLLGGWPFLLSWFVQLIIEPYVASISIYAAFSLAAFFLFVAVVPLMFAPETLPEKKIKERELKKYIEKAKKVKEKYD